MTWANFYLVCFLVGFILSLLSVVQGSLHVHLPHLDMHHGVPHVHVSHAHGGGQSGVSIVNFGTMVAFLAWFGGTGYLLTEYSALWFLTALGVLMAFGSVLPIVGGGFAQGIWFVLLGFYLSSAARASIERVRTRGALDGVPVRALMLTRFDVVATKRTRAFHHFTLGGDLTVEDEAVLAETIEDVKCRWCGDGGKITTVETT